MNLKANWSYPNQVHFGAGRIKELVDCCRNLKINNPLLVTDRGLAKLPITTNIIQILISAGFDVKLFSDVDINPNEKNLVSGIASYREGRHDGIIALGGGSGLDLGKIIAFMSGQKRPVWDFEDVDDWWKRANSNAIAPIIAIPTTAGTGSEVGRAGVLTNSETHEKKIIFHPKILPTIAILDPELCISMPPMITAGTGMDAFIHSLEAFSSPFFHPMSQGIALEGMRLVKENLIQAYHQADNIEARSYMLAAAAMGAVAFQKGLGATHAISHSVGALFNTHHGITNAIVVLEVLKLNRPAIESRIKLAANYLGISGGFDGFFQFLQDFLAELNIPQKLHALKVDHQQIDRLVSMALKDPSAQGNPIKMTQDNTKALIEACI